MKIQKKHKIDPYKISPSGDMFWADKRNIEKVKNAIQSKGNAIVLANKEDIRNFID